MSPSSLECSATVPQGLLRGIRSNLTTTTQLIYIDSVLLFPLKSQARHGQQIFHSEWRVPAKRVAWHLVFPNQRLSQVQNLKAQLNKYTHTVTNMCTNTHTHSTCFPGSSTFLLLSKVWIKKFLFV